MEIGESLCASWLKHVKRCAIVQTNWKPSFQWRERHEDFVARAWEYARHYFAGRNLNVVAENVDYYQALMQTECDCFGVSFDDDRGPMYYVLESAMHTGGLGYPEAPSKVASKMVRAALALHYFCGIKEAEIGFVTPKVSLDLFNQTLQAIDAVREFFQDEGIDAPEGINFTFCLYTNEPEDAHVGFGARFDEEIMRPICMMHPLVSDTSETFVRSINLHDRAVEGLRVVGSDLRRALKDLGMKFEQFEEQCETYTGIFGMIERLNDVGGSRVKAIRDYVSWRRRDVLHGARLSVADIRREAANEARQEAGVVQKGEEDAPVDGDVRARRRRTYDVLVGEQRIQSDLSMRAAALCVVQQYVDMTPDLTSVGLLNAFPRRVNRDHDTLICDGADHYDPRRYIGPITLANGERVYVCGEWIGNGRRANWQLFIAAAAAVGIDIIEHEEG